MNAAELPMILFTVLAQMCIGAFLVLGVGQLIARGRHSQETIDAVTDPTVYAIGPALVLGLLASMFHMHDVFNVLNVFRHLDSSWLSREVTFGVLFSGAGFLFAVLQWFKWGTPALRSALAAVTALLGVGLLVSMTMVYYSLRAVPAWHTWATPLQFIATTVLLGALLVGLTFVAATVYRPSKLDHGRFAARDTAEGQSLIRSSLRWLTLTAMLAAGAILVGMPLHLGELGRAGGAAAASLHPYTGALFAVRLALLVLGTSILGVFVYVLAADKHSNPKRITAIAAMGFIVVLLGEILGRAQFYESMMRVGM